MYEHRLTIHTVRRGSEVLVFEDVPTEVCDVCSDVLLESETIRHIEGIMREHGEPHRHAPMHAYS